MTKSKSRSEQVQNPPARATCAKLKSSPVSKIYAAAELQNRFGGDVQLMDKQKPEELPFHL